jgi:hypothetical protein
VCREEVAAWPGYAHKRLAPLLAVARADASKLLAGAHAQQQQQQR